MLLYLRITLKVGIPSKKVCRLYSRKEKNTISFVGVADSACFPERTIRQDTNLSCDNDNSMCREAKEMNETNMTNSYCDNDKRIGRETKENRVDT